MPLGERRRSELDDKVRRLALQAGRAAYILANSFHKNEEWTSDIPGEKEVGTTYSALEQPGGLVESTTVEGRGPLRNREYKRGPAEMSISNAITRGEDGSVKAYELTVYWQQDDQAASVTMQHTDNGPISYSVHETANANDADLESLPEVTKPAGALRVVSRALYVAGFFDKLIPSDVKTRSNV